MANEKKAGAAKAPGYKKGDVTIEGINFNDSWARGLKPRKIKEDDVAETSAEDQFYNEFSQAWPGMDPADKKALLAKAYKACLEAED